MGVGLIAAAGSSSTALRWAQFGAFTRRRPTATCVRISEVRVGGLLQGDGGGTDPAALRPGPVAAVAMAAGVLRVRVTVARAFCGGVGGTTAPMTPVAVERQLDL